MTAIDSIIKPMSAKTSYLHQRIDDDLKQAAQVIADKRYGINSLTTLVTALLLSDSEIQAEYAKRKNAKK